MLQNHSHGSDAASIKPDLPGDVECAGPMTIAVTLSTIKRQCRAQAFNPALVQP